MNMIKVDNVSIGTVLGCKKMLTPNKVVNTALDGSVYIQTVGDPIDRRQIHAYCDTIAMRNALDYAANYGAQVTIEWNNQTIVGYIENDVSWNEWKDGHGVGKFILLVDVE